MRPWLLLLLPLAGCIKPLDDTGSCAGPEVCNGEDDDCDGVVDEDVADAPAWYPDEDGDGFGDFGTFTIACTAPSGMVAEERATDCDDGDDAVHPGATEIWYDGVDSDCDGANDYDQDGDGHDHAAFDGDDCDDEDPDIHPGAAEVWYDGIDQDCAGDDDFDQDGDGFQSDAYEGDDCDDLDATVHPTAAENWYDGVDQDCAGDDDYDQDHDGYRAAAEGGDDCDDHTGTINPGATEIWYDGTDQDCDGASDFDQDGDGFEGEVDDAPDCNDKDPGIYPGRIDWLDGVDNDCDGETDWLPLDHAGALLTGESGADHAGSALAAPGDLDGDGLADFLVAAPEADLGAADAGVVYVVVGPAASGSLGGAAARLFGVLEDGAAGFAMAGMGDVDGDGALDIALGAPGEGWPDYCGAAYLVHGPFSGDLSLSDAELHLTATGVDDWAGWSVAGGQDLGAGSEPDLAVGTPDFERDAVEYGAAYVVDGARTGEVSLAEADAMLESDQIDSKFGCAVVSVGASSRDSGPMLVVGGPGWDEDEFEDVGGVWTFSAPLSGALSAADADGFMAGNLAGDETGGCVADGGDLTGDGYSDLLVGAAEAEDSTGARTGRVYVVPGPWLGEDHVLAASQAYVEGDGDGANLCAAAAPGDVDGDGQQDLLVGGDRGGSGASSAGTAYLILGPLGGTLAVDAIFSGISAGDGTGVAVAGPGDTDGDGHPDLLIGAGFSDAPSTNAGAAYLVLGSP